MSMPVPTMTPGPGNLAGWALAFLTWRQARDPAAAEAALVIGHQDYFARIEAALPGGLDGGRFAVTIEAMTDAHYAAARGASAAELYLFWQDVNASFGGFVSGLAGLQQSFPRAELAPALVARFAIRNVSRGLGLRGGDATFEGRDWAYDRLATTFAPRLCFDSLGALLRGIGASSSVTIVPEPSESTLLPPGTPPEAEQTGAAGEDRTCLAEVQDVVQRIASGLVEGAPSVARLRNGSLHLGRHPMGVAVPLDYTSGLAQAVAESGAGEGGSRRTWRLQLRGRPDLRPGSLISFKAPAEEAQQSVPGDGLGVVAAMAGSAFGSLAGLVDGLGAPEPPDTTACITAVTHRMSRTAGFQTDVTAIDLGTALPADPWTLFAAGEGSGPGRRSRGGDTATAVGRQVRDIAQSVLRRLRLPEVAELRAASAAPPARPHMTVTTWEGTEGNAGESHRLRRHAIARARAAEHQAVTMLTPFAWGACGLALPTYPGMRVMMGFRQGAGTEPFVLGATWGAGPRMQPQAGDWWLCLPRGAATADLAPSDRRDHEPGPDAPATHDLIDAAGNRVIQVGKLTLRIGADENAKAGTRPAAESAAFAIRHADGKAEITVDQNGVITLKGERIRLDAGSNGTVEINARDVNISVGNRVNVT